ncbi:MAG: hypothetical protein L0Z50_06270 [Verrucomicrobiales bacterium]|nr:hypothetical protein [Verrucomicrobiales bacterium]
MQTLTPSVVKKKREYRRAGKIVRRTACADLLAPRWQLKVSSALVWRYIKTMRRIYLAPDGTEHLPSDEREGHYKIAEIVLKRAGLPVGDAEECYAAMWSLGYVRVVDDGECVFAERYINGCPIREDEFTLPQRAYFQTLREIGRNVFLNQRQGP